MDKNEENGDMLPRIKFGCLFLRGAPTGIKVGEKQ